MPHKTAHARGVDAGRQHALRRFKSGADPIGLAAPRLPQVKLRSYQGIVPKTEDWRKLGASDEEKAYLDGIELDETDREMVAAAE